MKKDVLKVVLTIVKYGITLVLGILSGESVTSFVSDVI